MFPFNFDDEMEAILSAMYFLQSNLENVRFGRTCSGILDNVDTRTLRDDFVNDFLLAICKELSWNLFCRINMNTAYLLQLSC